MLRILRPFACSGLGKWRSVCAGAAVYCLAASPVSTPAASLSDKFEPETPYYFDHFDPRKAPWEPGQALNFEEVFKNYQYYEIVLGRDGKMITVNQYIRGVKSSSEKFFELPDGSLRKE